MLICLRKVLNEHEFSRSLSIDIAQLSLKISPLEDSIFRNVLGSLLTN